MNRKLMICVFLAFVYAMFAMDNTSPPALTLAERYENLSCALVRITADDGSFGSGFFVDDLGTVVTAAHVVMNVAVSMETQPLNRVIAHVQMTPKRNLKVVNKWGTSRDVELTTTPSDEEMASEDLAVIKTTFLPPCHLEIGYSSVHVGNHLIAMGFPTFDTLSSTLQNQIPSPVLYDGFLSSVHLHVPVAAVKGGFQQAKGGFQQVTIYRTYEVMRVQMPITPGASGGPVLTDDDRVAGVITEEPVGWSHELDEYVDAIAKLSDQRKGDKIKLPNGKVVDARQILGRLTEIVHAFESPGAGLAVPVAPYLKLSTAQGH